MNRKKIKIYNVVDDSPILVYHDEADALVKAGKAYWPNQKKEKKDTGYTKENKNTKNTK